MTRPLRIAKSIAKIFPTFVKSNYFGLFVSESVDESLKMPSVLMHGKW